MAVTSLTLTSLATSLFQDTILANAAVVVKASGGTLYAIHIDNSANASAVYLKLWDSAGAVVVGTTAPDFIIKVPASFDGPVLLAVEGITFASGLQAACVTEAGTAGTTSPGAAVVARIAFT